MKKMTELPSAEQRLDALTAQRVLCAVSGGMDSMCLLHFVLSWGRKRGVEVAAAHFNHQLRGCQADRDEAFVREICQDWGVTLYTGRGDTRGLAAEQGLSLEEAARTLRYRFLRETAQRADCQEILTAHHAQDNAETMLLNLVRGTGLRGLTGIPPSRDHVTRIFLETSRETLAAYAADHHISWVEDETNLDPDAAARNLLRWKVLPLLRELNPRAVEHMTGTAGQLREINAMLEAEIQQTVETAEIADHTVSIPLPPLLEAAGPIRSGVLLRLFELLGAGRKDVGASHIEALTKLAQRGEGQLNLPHGVTAACRQGRLILTQPKRNTERVLLEMDCLCRWGTYRLMLTDRKTGPGLWLGGDGPIFVGPCPPGGRLTLPQSRGARTIKRLCLDRGISLEKRDALPAIYVRDQLAAVWQLGVDVKFLPEGSARRFIQIHTNTEENEL